MAAMIYPMQLRIGQFLMKLKRYFGRRYFIVLTPNQRDRYIYFVQIFFHIVPYGRFCHRQYPDHTMTVIYYSEYVVNKLFGCYRRIVKGVFNFLLYKIIASAPRK